MDGYRVVSYSVHKLYRVKKKYLCQSPFPNCLGLAELPPTLTISLLDFFSTCLVALFATSFHRALKSLPLHNCPQKFPSSPALKVTFRQLIWPRVYSPAYELHVSTRRPASGRIICATVNMPQRRGPLERKDFMCCLCAL